MSATLICSACIPKGCSPRFELLKDFLITDDLSKPELKPSELGLVERLSAQAEHRDDRHNLPVPWLCGGARLCVNSRSQVNKESEIYVEKSLFDLTQQYSGSEAGRRVSKDHVFPCDCQGFSGQAYCLSEGPAKPAEVCLVLSKRSIFVF